MARATIGAVRVIAVLTVAAPAVALGAPQVTTGAAPPPAVTPAVDPVPPLSPAAPAAPATSLPFAVRIVPPPVTAPAATAVPVAATTQPLICRSTLQTGSLVARHRQCLTKAQWRYVDDAHETEARRLMMDNMTKPFCDAKC